MNILVTGGAGFIGSHLCEALLAEGHYVSSLDNYSTGSIDNHINGVTYINGNTSDIFNLIDDIPDIIYHLGEYSRVEQSFEDITKVLDYNKNGTMQVLEFVRITGCKLIYAGSSTKFGDNGSNSSPYAWSKASNTELVKNYGDWFGISYAITYFYNVYGPREISTGKYATLIAKFLEKYKNNDTLTVVSPGTQLRNYTHISDIISGLLLVGKYGDGDEYGIGADEAYSIFDIAKMFDSYIEMLPERDGNRMSAPVFNRRVKALGWKQTMTIDRYIKESIGNINE